MKETVSVLVVMIIALLIVSTIAGTSAGQNGDITTLPSQVFSKNDTKPPSVNITYPAYPPTITTGRIIIQGTANDSESGIKSVCVRLTYFHLLGSFQSTHHHHPYPLKITIGLIGRFHYRLILQGHTG